MLKYLVSPIAVVVGVLRATSSIFDALSPRQLVLCDLPTEHLYWIDPKRKVLRIASVDAEGRFDPSTDDDLTMDVGCGEGTPADLCARDRRIWETLARAAGDRRALKVLRRAGHGDRTMPSQWDDGVPHIDAARVYLVRLDGGEQAVPDPQLAALR